ncbi:MAG: hypothetical protein ACLUOS_05770 [Odoribacter splanchnicus]
MQIIPYGSTAQYVYTVSDTNGTDLDYVLEDPNKSVTATKQDGYHVDSEQQEPLPEPHCKIDGTDGEAFAQPSFPCNCSRNCFKG